MTKSAAAGMMTSVTASAQVSEESPKPKAKPRGRPFKPGQSGNPGGRPKGIATEARRLAGRDGRKLLKILADVALDSEQKTADRIRAAEIVLERGFGKSPAFAPIEGENPLALNDVDHAITAALDELAPRREAQATRRGEVADLAEARETGTASA